MGLNHANNSPEPFEINGIMVASTEIIENPNMVQFTCKFQCDDANKVAAVTPGELAEKTGINNLLRAKGWMNNANSFLVNFRYNPIMTQDVDGNHRLTITLTLAQ